jgi:hypothetical protein
MLQGQTMPLRLSPLRKYAGFFDQFGPSWKCEYARCGEYIAQPASRN